MELMDLSSNLEYDIINICEELSKIGKLVLLQEYYHINLKSNNIKDSFHIFESIQDIFNYIKNNDYLKKLIICGKNNIKKNIDNDLLIFNHNEIIFTYSDDSLVCQLRIFGLDEEKFNEIIILLNKHLMIINK